MWISGGEKSKTNSILTDSKVLFQVLQIYENDFVNGDTSLLLKFPDLSPGNYVGKAEYLSFLAL